MITLINLEKQIEQTFNFKLNKNQFQEIKRLIFEISRRDDSSFDKIIKSLDQTLDLKYYSAKNKFFALKNTLIKERFPLTSKQENINSQKIFLSKLQKSCLKNKQKKKKNFYPQKIFIEKSVKNSLFAKNLYSQFPNVKTEIITTYKNYLLKHTFNTAKFKLPFLFVIQEKWDFIKACPCAKKCLSCGYQILNLGFGCPFDCSYCFLQQYSNSPGIILPANIEDFFISFDKIYKNSKKPIRIGTGEFCDSLALDDITEYSKLLIPYFSQKNVLFELKTKSNKIANLLTVKASKNIIISWSLNPSSIIKNEEKGTATLNQRLQAAKKIQNAGFSIGFHFDPIIHLDGWEKLYNETIYKLYSCLKHPFAWISLGTLRCNRQLKTISELRFEQSNIFYGELLLGTDKKLRYPDFIKKEIYQKIIKIIRSFDKNTPIYLCMENKQTWSDTKDLVSSNTIKNSFSITT